MKRKWIPAPGDPVEVIDRGRGVVVSEAQGVVVVRLSEARVVACFVSALRRVAKAGTGIRESEETQTIH